MRKVELISINNYEWVDLDQDVAIPEFTKEDLETRVGLLLEKMEQDEISHVLIYADRENFANMQYFIGFEPRFEESLLILSQKTGELTLLVGNECMAYSMISPLSLRRVLYQNFSLQGQPREKLISLQVIFREAGLNSASRIGVIGNKYFEADHIEDHRHKVDIPAYIMEDLLEIVDRSQVINYTQRIKHPTEGIRMVLRTAKEVAYFESLSHRNSNTVIRMLKSLKPGMGELELSRLADYDAFPMSMFPIVNFGSKHVQLGLRSPDQQKLEEGDIVTICYALRGSLVARSGLASFEETDLTKGWMAEFYEPYFRAVAAWYESLSIGREYGETHQRVHEILGDQKQFGIYLNAGHLISLEEWPNSPIYQDSTLNMVSGHYLQCDIIASSQTPFRQAILEDGVILADASLRGQIQMQFPDAYARIQQRRKVMMEVLGIPLSDDVLPLSNCQAILHPFLLDVTRCFALKD